MDSWIHHLVSLSNFSQVLDHLIAGGRVESGSWFIEEKDFRSRDQLAGYAKPTLLPATNPSSYWRSNDGVGLVLQPESGKQFLYSTPTLTCCNRAGARQQRLSFDLGETYRGSDSRAAKSRVSLTVRLPIRASSCST